MAARGATARKPLSAAKLAAFEKKHGVSLPEDYAAFLTQLGNGTEGEHGTYSLLPLGTRPGGYHESKKDYLAHLGERFPLAKRWIAGDDPSFEKDLRKLWHGALPVADAGGGEIWVVVATGKQRGKVWQVSFEGAAPNAPARGFLDWYEYWLKEGAPDDWWNGAGTKPTRKPRKTNDAWTNEVPFRAEIDDQRDLLYACYELLPAKPVAARKSLSGVTDLRLAGGKAFFLAWAELVEKKPGYEQGVLAVAEHWLAPATLGSVNQFVERKTMAKLLDGLGTPRAKALAKRVRASPVPELVLPEGDVI